MKRSYFTPLIWFIAPTVLIGYGIVIPGSCIGGVNQLSVGFASSLLGTCVESCLRECSPSPGPTGGGAGIPRRAPTDSGSGSRFPARS